MIRTERFEDIILSNDIITDISIDNELNLFSDNPVTNSAIYNKILEIEDYTRFYVYPTDTNISAGISGYSVDIPAQMKFGLHLKVTTPKDKSDVIIDWGDGTISEIKNEELIDEPFPTKMGSDNRWYVDLTNISSGLVRYVPYNSALQLYNIYILHTYSEAKEYPITIYGSKYYGFSGYYYS